MPDFHNQRLALSDLPQLEPMDFSQIDQRYRYPLYGSVIVFYAFLLIGVAVVALVWWGPLHWLTFFMLILWFCGFLFTLFFNSERVKRMKYAIREHDVSYADGVIFQECITIPFNRIQHCELSRGFFERIYKLASLKIYTAGGSGSDISIPGLSPDLAQRLRDFIVRKIRLSDEEE